MGLEDYSARSVDERCDMDLLLVPKGEAPTSEKFDKALESLFLRPVARRLSNA